MVGNQLEPGFEESNPISKFTAGVNQKIQFYLDKSAPHVVARWASLGVMLLLYSLRVWWLRGFYIVTYGLGIYNLNLFLGFITPQVDPELEDDGPELPTKSDQEFRPFIRRLPEMKFWWAAMKSMLLAFAMTFSSVFDVPVFWPILLVYWCLLFMVTMKRQIKHMLKYKYLPFTWGKKKYGGGSAGGKKPRSDK